MTLLCPCPDRRCVGKSIPLAPDLEPVISRWREQITSGLRCPKHNAAVGGSKNSSHLSGRALDLAVPDVGDFLAWLRTGTATTWGVILYEGAGHVHIDVRNQHEIWVAVKAVPAYVRVG